MRVYIQFDATGEWIGGQRRPGRGAKTQLPPHHPVSAPTIPPAPGWHPGGCRVYSMVREYYDVPPLNPKRGGSKQSEKEGTPSQLQRDFLNAAHIIRPAG